jgi:malonate-semialdehyde dehydrogenase (acetylating) / methylmalonate-semialdehyde dehydrogenase
MRHIEHWIDNECVSGGTERQAPVFNPASGEQVAVVGLADAELVDEAVQAAFRAFPAWRAMSLSKRSEILYRMRDLVDHHRDELADLVTEQHGKVKSDALGEVSRALEAVEFACGISSLLKGAFTEQASSGVDVFSIRQPLGVVAGVTPFNFPVMVPAWMYANAIACGNTFVLKPSEKDPGAAILIARLWRQAGLPDGVFNVLQGDGATARCLIEHPDVVAVSFVGSTPIARQIYEDCARIGKRVQALGGAKNHMVVLPDADLDLAADAAVSAGFGSAGERCMAISVVVAVGQIADELVEKLAERTRKITLGDGMEADSEMGPLVTEEHMRRVEQYLDDSALAGADLVIDGRASKPSGPGFFLGPSLVDHVKPGTPVYDDEIFGPVLGIVRVSTLAEAMELIDRNPYGNGAAIFTRSGGSARQFQFGVSAGMVGVNVPIPVPVSYYSFGGWNASLFGDCHIYGPEGVQFYTRSKVVTTRWEDSPGAGVDLRFPAT